MPYKDPARQLQYQKDWQHNRLQAWLRANGPCACGSWENLRRDSIDGRPKAIGSVWTASPKRQAVELARYRVVCEACLARATKPLLVHNRTGYRNGCRCDVCRAASTKYRRELRYRHRRP